MSWVALAGTAALLGTLAVVGACGPSPACTNDAACGAAARCDPVAKVCMQRTETTDCSPSCAEWQFCSEAVCYARYEKIVIVDPISGAKVDGGSTVRAQLQTVAPWVQEKVTSKLELRVSNTGSVVNSGDLSPDGGTYAGHLSMTQQGTFTLTAGFPGFPSGAPVSDGVTIDVDTVAPTLTVTPNPKTGLRDGSTPGQPSDIDLQLANAFKRNDIVTVAISTPDPDFDPNSIALSVRGMTTNVPVSFVAPSRVTTCPGQAYCFTGTADLSNVEMLALRGQMTIVATGRDQAGNLGTGMAQIPVTRFKWSRAMPGVTSIQASPAVGVNGTVFIGTTTGTLSAIRPDGTNQWTSPVSLGSAFLASPSVGKGDGTAEVVYAFPGGTPPVLFAFFGSNGSDAGFVTAGGSGSVQASPVVANTTTIVDTTRETATTFLNGATGLSLASLRFGYSVAATGPVGSAGAVAFPGNIVGDDNLAFAGDDSNHVREYSFSSGGGSWSEAGTTRATPDAPTGLALTSSFVAGASVGSVFTFPRTTGTAFSRPETGPSIPVITGGDLLYSVASDGGTTIRLTPNGSGTVVATAGVGGTTTSPLLANGQVSYLVRKNNNALFALGPGLNVLWSDTVEPSISVASSPNIDCARNTDGSKRSGPGTLYYGANNGKLYAIIVDNPGIDTTSPWPKYQHDPRNTGSLSTPLSEFTCP